MTEMTIWKFPIFDGFSTTGAIEMPEGAEIVTMQRDLNGSGPATVWARVDPNARKTLRRFQHVGTGQPIPSDGVYLGTWQQESIAGFFVFHVFEVPITTTEGIR